VDDHEREALLNSLNEEECRTLYWLCRGLSRTEMAQRLFVSESAVYYRLAKIWEKLDIDHLERHVRLHVLVQDFCPLVLNRVEDPEHDCKRRGTAGEDAAEEEAPSPETIETVKEDEETGLIPITQSIVRRPKRDSDDHPPIVIDYQDNPAPPRAPRWLAPALLGIAFLFGVVAVLLVLNLTRQPARQVVVVTSTLAPTQRSGETATPDVRPGSIPTKRIVLDDILPRLTAALRVGAPLVGKCVLVALRGTLWVLGGIGVLAVAALALVDPVLIAVTEDGYWVEIDRWLV